MILSKYTKHYNIATLISYFFYICVMEKDINLLLDDLCNLGIEDIEINISKTLIELVTNETKNIKDLMPLLRGYKDFYGRGLKALLWDESGCVKFTLIDNSWIKFLYNPKKIDLIFIGFPGCPADKDRILLSKEIVKYKEENPGEGYTILDFFLWSIRNIQQKNKQ